MIYNLTFCIQYTKLTCTFVLFLFIILFLSKLTLSSQLQLKANSDKVQYVIDSGTVLKNNFFSYQCFETEATIPDNLNLNQLSIGLQVTNHVTHQIMSRIFAIFLRELLNYKQVALIPIEYNMWTNNSNDESLKTWLTLELIRHHKHYPDMNMINLEVWMSSLGHFNMPDNIYEAGPSISPGRFGWFVPYILASKTNNRAYSLHYEVFRDPKNVYYKLYELDDELLYMLKNYTGTEIYVSPKCMERGCVTLIAEYRNDSLFIEQQIEETNSYLNVLWLGAHFSQSIKFLYDTYRKDMSNQSYGKSFIVLHWTPSNVIDGDIKFIQITMPRCEEYQSLLNSTCKYELTPVLKYYYKNLASESRIKYALRAFFIEDAALRELQQDLKTQIKIMRANSISDIYNKVACNWLKNNVHIYNSWVDKENRLTLSIGGIFPLTLTTRGHQNIFVAVQSAVEAINRNTRVLADYNLEVLRNDGQCKADMVMKAFIHYFNAAKVLGVLGPACSETVEPIAGISKHMSMAVISYSAEGASFADRQEYPYFFRTIGSNRQYEDVYINLMDRLGWQRVAALTEDGQKYTEYISHLEATLKQHNFEMILNKKFLSDATAVEMNKHLLDLKTRHAKIIIADIHNRNAAMALCEATKLGMTGRDGYVWFLPSWLSKDTKLWCTLTNHSCSYEQLSEALDGHFSIMHAPFGESQALMQEGITIEKWLSSYKTNNGTLSNYIGFAYDGVWAYALAAEKLLRENREALNSLRSKTVVNRFTELLWETDFQGLSGRVRFGQGGSRITTLNILQWQRNNFIDVGRFEPEIVGSGKNRRPAGGKLILNMSDIKWLSGTLPSDGKYDCGFSSLAKFLDTDCDNAAVVFATSVCFFAVFMVSLVSFFFWKQRYDRKLRRSAKIMKTFGIDLLSPSRNNGNTLDKWEIPKDNVVVNRRLGEGAFGTVYGGEAQVGSDDWKAVAVKTLKAGASTEDRLDFLSEAEAMKRFDHKNIVKLLAVCLQSEPIYTIMEFMLYGDLKTYLLARRNMVNERTSDESDISPKRLTMYAMDVARGLAYLAEQKYVHRDLACRNCLVNSQRVVKIGDFGMARAIFESDYYRFNRKGMLPVRWMAPESLVLGMFTPSSDVWAFGVVLYEIITFGSYPYQGLTNNQVLEYVKRGSTLQIPTGVKPQLEGLLKACWSQETKKRPTASEVIDYISNYPRLLTPCLDFPGAAVEMPETESDQLELLPKARKCSPLKRDSTLDILAQTNSSNNLEKYNNFIHEVGMPYNSSSEPSSDVVSVPLGSTDSTFSPITPDGYSIMSPLLLHQDNSSQSHLLKNSQNETLQLTSF